jgi:serine/threonine protein kinase
MSEDLCAQIRKALPSKTPHHLNELKIFVLGQLRQFVKTQGKSHSISAATLALVTGTEVFSSEWLDHLRSRGILMNPEDELNWSGRGQHVEYTAKEEKDIPLRAEKILGHSATAIVESVMCRRIRLARKRIRCSRKLSKEDAITEVEHLQRLQHSHIVRVVGTYTLKKDLAILLYPAAEWNLEEFMDDTIDAHGEDEWQPQSEALKAFFGCLAHTIRFLHRENVKHMDIKPKNILVRPIEKSGLDDKLGYKVYIADFGIARAYQSAAEVETDSPTSYTRTYAAPEVVDQDKRGFSADIFSLGCVYMEMLATLLSKPAPELNEKLKLQGCRRNENGDSAYYANIASVLGWYMALSTSQWESLAPTIGLFDEGLFHIHMPRMIEELPKLRPDARSLSECTRRSRCSKCGSGPEPFEAAKMSPT